MSSGTKSRRHQSPSQQLLPQRKHTHLRKRKRKDRRNPSSKHLELPPSSLKKKRKPNSPLSLLLNRKHLFNPSMKRLSIRPPSPRLKPRSVMTSCWVSMVTRLSTVCSERFPAERSPWTSTTHTRSVSLGFEAAARATPLEQSLRWPLCRFSTSMCCQARSLRSFSI